MDVDHLFAHMPFADHLGIEVTSAEDGRATGRLSLGDEHSSSPRTVVAHGGVAYALADTVAGAAVVSATGEVAPTVDTRIDYHAPATGDALRATAEVTRLGSSVATVDVAVSDETGTSIASVRGVFKTGGGDGPTAWTSGGDGSAAGDPEEPEESNG